MKNYKILKDRPELTKEQLTQGMDFAGIKANAAIAKKAILKSLIIKAVVAAVIVSSGIFIYKTISSPSEKLIPAITADTIANKNSTGAKPVTLDETFTDTIKVPKQEVSRIQIKPTAKAPEPEVSRIQIKSTTMHALPDTVTAKTVCNLVKPVNPTAGSGAINEPKNDSVIYSHGSVSPAVNKRVKNYKAKVKACKIWLTNDFCSIPKTAKFPVYFNCGQCDFDYVDCKTVSPGNVTAVWITVTVTEKSALSIESGLKNFGLIQTGSDVRQSPLMVDVNVGAKFLSANLKAKNYTAHFNKQIDLFLFFKNARAGDKIIIDNFIEAAIEP